MEALSTHFRSYAVDLWGFGDSIRQPQNTTLEAQVELVEIFLAELGLQRVAMIGHGYGSVIAQEFALKNPEKVDRLLSVRTNEQWISVENFTMYITHEWLTKTAGLDDGIARECMKATPLAVSEGILSVRSADSADQSVPMPHVYPHLVLSYEGKTKHLDNKVLDLKQPILFPMIQKTEEFNRLVLDFLTSDPISIEHSISAKEFWKRRVR